MLDHFRAFWSWLNSNSIAPWVLAAITAIYAFGSSEARVVAQAEELQRLDSKISAVAAHRDTVHTRDFQELKQDIVSRLEKIDRKLDVTSEKVEDLKSDVAVVCSKVNGRCK